MTDLNTLASMVEAATGPDRELEWAIALALHPFGSSRPNWRDETPRYLRSIDDAMQLVDPGVRRVEFGSYEDGSAWAYVHTETFDSTGESQGAFSEPAAISAAAIRAAMGEG